MIGANIAHIEGATYLAVQVYAFCNKYVSLAICFGVQLCYGLHGFYPFLVLLRLVYVHLVSPKRINHIAINSPKISVIDRTRNSSLIQLQRISI